MPGGLQLWGMHLQCERHGVSSIDAKGWCCRKQLLGIGTTLPGTMDLTMPASIKNQAEELGITASKTNSLRATGYSLCRLLVAEAGDAVLSYANHSIKSSSPGRAGPFTCACTCVHACCIGQISMALCTHAAVDTQQGVGADANTPPHCLRYQVLVS